MQKGWWNQIHDQRLSLLQPGFDLQRCGCRGYRARECERKQKWMEQHEPKLGAKLAIQCQFSGPGPFLQSHGQ